MGLSASPHVSYELTDSTRLLWEFDYSFDEFEEIGGTRDGSILQIQEFMAGIGLAHRFNDHIASSIGVGGIDDLR